MEILESLYQLDEDLSNNPPSQKEKVFAWMKENKVEEILIGFSGGNDEGGVDDGVLLTEGATAIDFDVRKLSDFLTSPIFSRYGGFAGDFYVDGTLTWLASGKILFDGREQG
jgi:hypothetical protein